MLKALVIKYMYCGFKKYGSPRHRGTVSYSKEMYSSLTTCTVAPACMHTVSGAFNLSRQLLHGHVDSL